MKFNIKHLLLLILLTAIGIGINQLDLFVADWRKGNGVCAIHDEQMNTVIVCGLDGTVNLPPDYYDAKIADFPNCGVEYPEELYSKKRGKIFVCNACEKNRLKWFEN